MTSDQATFLREFLLPQVEDEAKTTRRVISAVPADKSSYSPDPVSKNALDLAWHIASADVWFLESVAKGEFPMEESPMPAELKTPADIAAWYDRALAAGIQKVRALTGDQLAKSINFFGVLDAPNVTFLQFLIKHSVHHRGQLSAYLRAMGGKVPSIYGGSADEPFQMPATA